MFSRRHPYLFFFMVMTTVGFTFVLLLGLIFRFGPGSSDSISGEKVGVIEITGVITDSKPTIDVLRKYRDDDSVKAIVLRIDSPGGGVGPSQEIYREVKKTLKTKKVITSMGAVAASGGYYIAAATNGIVANPGTITGSIGVIMGYTNIKEIFKKIGLTPIVVKSGEFKDIGSPLRDMTEKEKKILQDFVEQIHRQFVTDAANGRSMPFEKMMSLADGRIYSGETARKLGLIDRLGNLEDAIEWAGRLGGIKGKVQRVYPKERSIDMIRDLMESSIRILIENLNRPSVLADYL